MMLRLVVTVVAASLASACVVPDPIGPVASQAEVDLAVKNVTECGNRMVPLLDDGVSPADIVGRGVSTRCYTEVAAWKTTLTKGHNALYVQGFDGGFKPETLFTDIVLSSRVDKKKGK